MSEWNVTITTTNHSVVYSGSLIIGMMKSKNIKKSWYCEFQVHYRVLINLNYCDFPSKIIVIKFFPKNHGNRGNFYPIVTMKKNHKLRKIFHKCKIGNASYQLKNFSHLLMGWKILFYESFIVSSYASKMFVLTNRFISGFVPIAQFISETKLSEC